MQEVTENHPPQTEKPKAWFDYCFQVFRGLLALENMTNFLVSSKKRIGKGKVLVMTDLG